jgi:predicted RNase H-like HicB family nuclease
MKDYHINIFYSDEDGGYIADIPDLEACSAFAKTPEKALAEVEIAKVAWLKAARKAGKRGEEKGVGSLLRQLRTTARAKR